MRLISGLVDSYLRLTREEERRFERAIVSSGLAPAEKEQIMEVSRVGCRPGLSKALNRESNVKPGV